MQLMVSLVTRLSRILDKIAGLCIASAMVLVVANVILRAVFHRPILGAYELVGFLTALGIALALAQCAVENGHIAVTFIVDRFPVKLQAIIDLATGGAALVFWAVCAWHLGKEAGNMTISGVVSSTAQIPVAPVIYLVGLGLAALSLVLFFQLERPLKQVFSDLPLVNLLWQPKWEKATR